MCLHAWEALLLSAYTSALDPWPSLVTDLDSSTPSSWALIWCGAGAAGRQLGCHADGGIGEVLAERLRGPALCPLGHRMLWRMAELRGVGKGP